MEKLIFEHLREIGCCKICSVRYFSNKTIDLAYVDEYLQKSKIIVEEPSEEVSQCNKKLKSNPCLVCLGLLQENSIEGILQHEKLKDALSYDSKVFTCSISMPACIILREHSVRAHMHEKFPEFYILENNEIPLNRAWKMFVRKPLAKFLEKEYENSEACGFSINICFDHPNDEEELSVLKVMHPATFEKRAMQRRKFNGELFGRKCVTSVLDQTSKETFREHCPVPPAISASFVSVKSIDCKHNPIYFAGRYLKFSRELSQSPWVIDGVKMAPSSVQEIIFESVLKVFGLLNKDLKFSSSGREDCDVRCLGKGRPFYIEIADPKKRFSPEQFRALESAINESKDIQVTSLQHVEKSELSHVKEGEESKTKDYNALCKTKNPVTEEQIAKINDVGSNPLEVSQSTPIRVLHRRPLAVRPRTIHKMTAKTVEGYPNIINLSLNTQAGTYVKEFVHGDFDRTWPNLQDIIKDEVDLIALDVTSINLDWPPDVVD